MTSTVSRAAWIALAALLLAPVSALADAAADLHAAYAKMLGARFASETVTTDHSGRETRTSARYETIERIHITTDTGGFIVLPEGTWMQMGKGGEWNKPPFDMSKMFKQLIPATLADLRSGATNVRDEGTRTIEGATLRVISYDFDARIIGMAVSTHVVTYLDDAGRILRVESDGTAMKRKSRSVQILSYDDGIRVTAP